MKLNEKVSNSTQQPVQPFPATCAQKA